MHKSLITFAHNKLIALCMVKLCQHCLTDSWSSGSAAQKLCAKEKQKTSKPQKLRIMQTWGLHTETNLCVPSTNIKHGGVVGFCDESTHLNVPDAVVDTEERLPPKLCDCTSHQSHRHQGGPHTRAWKRKRWRNKRDRERGIVCQVGVIKDMRKNITSLWCCLAGIEEHKSRHFMDIHMIATPQLNIHLWKSPSFFPSSNTLWVKSVRKAF